MWKYISDKFNNFIKNTVLSIFSYGNLPRSIALIMDGNRRYAANKGIQKIQGHEDGLSKLLEVLEWSLYFSIKEVTCYALSIDNFNRSEDELKDMMKLVREKFVKLSEKNEYFNKYGVRVCMLGNLDFLEKEIKELLNKLEKNTEQNSK